MKIFIARYRATRNAVLARSSQDAHRPGTLFPARRGFVPPLTPALTTQRAEGGMLTPTPNPQSAKLHLPLGSNGRAAQPLLLAALG